MNKEEFLKRLDDAVNTPKLQQLFTTLMLENCVDMHYFEVTKGFGQLKQYVNTRDTSLLEKAIRNFDYVLDKDLKYVKAISYYGKTIANAYYHNDDGFSNAYYWVNKLIRLNLTWGTDRTRFIENLQSEAKHLKEDIRRRDLEANPIMSRWRLLTRF